MNANDIRDAAYAQTMRQFGLQKVAETAVDPIVKKVRDAYMRQGALSGGLRGALIGGAGGYLTSDEDDDKLKRTLMGVGLGGVAGAGLGAAHGRYLTRGDTAEALQKNLLRQSSHGGRDYLDLKSPGTFMSENIATTYHPGDWVHNVYQDRGKAQKGVAYTEAEMSDFAKKTLREMYGKD